VASAGRRIDRAFTSFARQHSITILRVALGIVFVWFGVLKVTGHSPVEDLVIATVPWAPEDYVVTGLGIYEIAIGLGLLAAILLRVVLILFWLQLFGTFLVLVMHPSLAFQGGNPFLLTVEGEFVVKNIVLIAAGLVVASTVRGR
jgi:putative oxidoreductase